MNDSPNDTGFTPTPITGGGDPSLPPIPALPTGTAPEPDFKDSVCLKGKEGKCKHLWVIQTNYTHGNAPGTFADDEEPRAINRSCLRSNEEMDLKGVVVHVCSEHSDPDFADVAESFVFEEPEPKPTPPAPVMPLVKLTKKETTTHE